MERRSFRAMGTEIELFLDAHDAEPALRGAETEFHRLEAVFSRFRDDSELSRLNRDGTINGTPDFVLMTELALDARERTGGRFDPTVHDALVAAGYDRTFEQLPPDGNAGVARCGGAVEMNGSTIVLEPGFKLDFGGIAKGFAAERAATILGVAGPCLVNAGGDVAVRGRSWPVGVQTSTGTLTLELSAGGLATSGRDKRRWRRDGREQHHLIDPLSGRPAGSDLLRVTMVAGDAVEAEIWAKALFLRGVAEAEREADEHTLPCVLVTDDGSTTLAGGLRCA